MRLIYWLFIFAFGSFYIGMSNILATSIWLSKKTIYTSISSAISLVVLFILCSLLIPNFGAVGAAISFLLCCMTQAYCYFQFGARLYFIPFNFWRVNLTALCLFAGLVIYSNLIDDLEIKEAITIGAFIFVVGSTLMLCSCQQRRKKKILAH